MNYKTEIPPIKIEIFGLLLLVYHIVGVFGVRNIPPVTAILTALQTAIYTRMIGLPWDQHFEVCVSAFKVFHKKDYKPLIYAAFEHGDDWHLYYNMSSFIRKGQLLEKKLSSMKFLYLIFLFAAATNLTFVSLCALASLCEESCIHQCAIGFSGVIFALKVLVSHYDPNHVHHFLGVPILLRPNLVVWVELLVIQLLSSGTSFLGHLAGILVGLAYVKTPIGYVVDGLYSLMAAPASFMHEVLLSLITNDFWMFFTGWGAIFR